MIIAVDAMGGDFAPFKIVRGAFLAAACKKIPVALFGPQNIISAELDACSRSWQNYPIIIHDAAEIIEMDEEPVSAIQKCFGKAGTVIFADTSGLHKGGYVLSAPRLMYTATYLTKAAVSPIHLAYTGNRASLPPLARLALAR